MKGIKRFSVAALGLGVAGALISTGMASADPSGSPAGNTRPLQGTGSDTSEEIMNALSDVVTIGGQKVISSYNANGGAFTSRPSGCSYAATGTVGAPDGVVRPNGSGQGRSALVASETAGNPRQNCLDFARSSSIGSTAGSNLTYIPFAKDAVAFAVTASSNLPKQLSIADLRAMYDCTYPGFEDSSAAPGWQSTFKALIPQSGSGSRDFFYNTILGYANSTLTGDPATVRGCVSDEKDRSGRGDYTNNNGIQEHRANVLDNNSIVGVSIGQYIAQVTGVSPSFIGKGVLGSIVNTAGDIPSHAFLLNPTYGTVAGAGDPQNAPATRDIYNVVPTADLSDPEVDQVFTGSDSLVCLQSAVIAKFGFGTLGAACGSTTLTRNN